MDGHATQLPSQCWALPPLRTLSHPDYTFGIAQTRPDTTLVFRQESVELASVRCISMLLPVFPFFIVVVAYTRLKGLLTEGADVMNETLNAFVSKPDAALQQP